MKLLLRPLKIVQSHRRPYLALNLIAYGLLIIGLAIGALFPDLTNGRTDAIDQDGTAEGTDAGLGDI